jgi:hypothetical protein
MQAPKLRYTSTTSINPLALHALYHFCTMTIYNLTDSLGPEDVSLIIFFFATKQKARTSPLPKYLPMHGLNPALSE